MHLVMFLMTAHPIQFELTEALRKGQQLPVSKNGSIDERSYCAGTNGNRKTKHQSKQQPSAGNRQRQSFFRFFELAQ
jgi:hypothetical protein